MRSDWRKAAISEDVKQLQRLSGEGVDINCRDQHGQTALMLASRRGCRETVRFLIDRGASLDVTAKYSLSALMLAVINRHDNIARMLIEAGADTTIAGSGAPGFFGKTAYDLALENERHELANLTPSRCEVRPD